MNPLIRVRKAQGLMHQLPFSRSELHQALQAMVEALDCAGRELELELVDEAAMAELNLAFLGCIGPTNILSFPAGDDPGSPLGQLVLAPCTMQREALLYGQEPGLHTLRLLAHGLVHLTGQEHGPDMDAMTDAALAAACEALGLPAPGLVD